MKKITWIVIAILIAVIGFSSLSKKEQQPFKIGVLVPLTGKFASFGEDIKKGIEIAQSEGVDISVIYEDSGAEPKTALSASSKLINSDKVNMVLAGPGSSANLAVAPDMEKSKTVFMAISSTPKLNDGGEYIFKLMPDIDFEIEMIVPYMVSKDVKKLGVLFESSSDTQVSAKDKMTEMFGKENVVSQGFDGKSTDYRTQISLLGKPDAFYILTNEKNAGSVMKQIRSLGLKQPIYGPSTIVGGEFFKGAGTTAEGVIVTDQPFSCAGTEAMKTYCEKYKSGARLTYGARAYDMMKIIAAVQKEKGDLREAFTNHTYVGVSGEMVFDQNGNITKQDFEIREARGGVFVDVN